MKQHYQHNSDQRGNVLFLILIAVALFAALSYAVTQSSRSGGDASRETNLLNSAQITQYPTSLQTAALRMIIDGRSTASILFTPPADYGTASNQYLFHPNGGGAVYQTVPADLMAAGSDGEWVINGEYAIDLIGTEAGDVIAFLPGISEDLCMKINVELGVGAADGTPDALAADESGTYMNSYADADTRSGVTAVSAFGTDDAFDASYTGQPFGCFQNGGGGGDFVYYHTIMER